MSSDQLGRALSLYRRTATSRSAMLLLIANVIPIIGVVFFGWSLLTILVLYWIENGIVGFWNVPKIVMAQGSIVPVLPELPASAALAATGNAQAAADLQAKWAQAREAQLAEQAAQRQTQRASRQAALSPGTAGMAGMGAAMNRLAGVGRAGLAIFFAFHYGVFWVVHGLFVFALPAFGMGFGAGAGDDGVPCFPGASGPMPVPGQPGSTYEALCSTGAFGDVIWSNVLLAAVALFLSHGASFLFNYIGRGEYLVQSAARQMAAPYGRVIVLHLTIIFGSMVVAFLGAPIAALLILVGLKTAFDLGLHLREHRNAGPPFPKGASPA
jgi:hypothetical protein